MSTFYALTKIDLAAIRTCDQMVIRRDPEVRVYCVKTARKTAQNPFATDVHHNLPVPVEIAHSWNKVTDGCTAFEMLWNYPSQVTQFGCILATLRVGDEIRFIFEVDGHQTQALEEAGFHADMLQMEVRRTGKTIARWEMSVKVCQDNTARMIKGSRKRIFDKAE